MRLPPPENPIVSLPTGCDAEEAACGMFLASYDIIADSDALKSQPSNFESLRGNYHLRRELPSFSLPPDAPFADYLRMFGIR